MLVKTVDSINAPTAAQLDLAYADGVRAWNGYLYWPKNWGKANFDLIKAHGMRCLAYATGWGDPAAARTLAASWEVKGCLDIENGTRPNGSWVAPWLATSGFGYYASESGYPIDPAPFHVVAAYINNDPGSSWPSGLAVPGNTPHGWQWHGSIAKYGTDVDLCWFDDAIFGIGTMDDMSAQAEQQIADLWAAMFELYGAVPGSPKWNNLESVRRGVANLGSAYSQSAEYPFVPTPVVAGTGLTAVQAAAVAQIPAIASAIAAGAVTQAHIEAALRGA